MDAGTPNEARDHLPFGRHHAFIIGINAYEKLSPLQTAVDDARRLAEVLSGQQHFLVHPLLLNATGDAIRTLLHSRLAEQVGKDDRVFFYFAGHGIAADGDDGPAGYIVPADADPTDVKTFIAMSVLQRALDALPCRHLLLVLDCCFSGAFKWSSRYRAIGTVMPKRIYKERFDRFIQDAAWQVITSAAYDQKALDVLRGIGKVTGDRGITKSEDHIAHSPFARALFEGLAGAADAKGEIEGDGVITATELYLYIRDQVEPQTIGAGHQLRQTPGFFPLKKHDKGEFIFLHPRHRLNLPPIPKRSPYKGLASFDESDQLLFYGRDRVIDELRAKAEKNRLLVISGASGTGKSSVVKAGLLPLFRAEGFRILPVIRPGAHPLAVLEQVLEEAHIAADAAATPPTGTQKSILLIDQLEELITRCGDANERQHFEARLRRLLDEDSSIHQIILTVRADFEPQLNSGELKEDWMAGRCTVPPFSLEELKEVIVMPTIQEVLIFDPPQMVDEIIAEVVQSPGALPLLSYALSELYEAYRTSGRQDRALKKTDYDILGGVMGALRTKADRLYQEVPAPEQNTMRKILLRMVSVEGDLASKRVPMDDLVYSDADKPLVDKVVEKLVEARLIVKGQDYIEPAHDALVRAWKTLHEWIHEAGRDKLILGSKLNASANEFAQSKNSEFLWNTNPNLPVVDKELKNPRQWFNAKETAFIQKSVARKKLRFRISVGLAATIGIVVLISAGIAWDREGKAVEQTAVAEAQKNRAIGELRRARALSLVAEATRVLNGTRSGRDNEALLQLVVADRLSPGGEAEGALLSALSSMSRLLKLIDTGAAIGGMAVTSSDTQAVSANHDNRLRLWDLSSGLQVGTPWTGHTGPISGVVMTPDGTRAISSAQDGTVRFWDLRTGKQIIEPTARHNGITALAVTRDGERVASASADSIRLWDPRTGQPVGEPWPAQNAWVLAYSPDGARIVTGGGDDRLRMIDARNGEVIGNPWEPHDSRVVAVAFSPDGQHVVSASRDKTLRLWNSHTGAAVGKPWRGHADWVTAVAYSLDGQRVVSGGDDGTLRLWNALDGRPIGQPMRVFKGTVTDVKFTSDAQRVVASSRDGTIRVWHAGSEPAIGEPWVGHNHVHRLAISPDGSRLVSASAADGPLRLWNTRTGQPIGEPWKGHENRVNAVAYSPGGGSVVSGSDDSTIRLWNAESGKQLWLSPPPGKEPRIGRPQSLAFSPDGQRIVSDGGKSFALRVWDATSGEPIDPPWPGHEDGVRAIAFSADGSHVVSGDGNGVIRLWNAHTATAMESPWLATRAAVHSVTFSKDGRFLTGHGGGTIRLWDARGKPIGEPWRAHIGAVLSIAINADGTRVVSGGIDNSIRLWNLVTAQPIGDALRAEGMKAVTEVVMSPDGKRVFSADQEAIRSWFGPTGVADEVCARLAGNMTVQQWERLVSKEIKYEEQCRRLPISTINPVVIDTTTRMQSAPVTIKVIKPEK